MRLLKLLLKVWDHQRHANALRISAETDREIGVLTIDGGFKELLK